MKFAVSAMLALVIALCAGCASTGKLPVPETPKQAGTFALVDYGLAASVANTYLNYPLCTQPLTVVPCKTQSIADKVKKADKAAHDAAIAADAAAGDVDAQNKAAKTLKEFKEANADAKKAENGGAL